MTLFVSHPLLVAEIGSCIFESLSQAQQFLVAEFGWKDTGLTQTDALKINDSSATKSSASSKNLQKVEAIEAKDGSSVDSSNNKNSNANKNKQGIAILLFSAAMIAMAYIFMML